MTKSNLFRLLLEITRDVVIEIVWILKKSLRKMALAINILLPYLMLYAGQKVALQRGNLNLGGEVFIPVFFGVISFYISKIADKMGVGNSLPVPKERFTSVSDDDEVSVDMDKTQSLLLYVADLEDWLERKGLL